MNHITRYILFLSAVLFVSCVPTKNLTYLQKKDSDALAPAMNPVLAKPYRLQANDIIHISIKALDQKLVDMFSISNQQNASPSGESLYFSGYTVDDHGNIRIPVLGSLNVLGYTLEEVRVMIESKLLDEYFTKEATIYVSVKLAGFHYTINGEVTSPGSKILLQDKVNIMEAIANAGDITQTGDRKSVAVIRQLPQGSEIHTIDLTDISAMQSPYYYLQPNDYVYVKPLPQKSWGTGTTGLQSVTTVISIVSLLTTITLLLTR
ncbi:polysaccharide biosynthesis/export family protein [Flavobacterium longum]|uniref:polysaccharide biosynthesis/export family protein n=1 Tax=Flavobacterium longum TaxID=1299340 RepID=UPI0039E74EB1